MRVILQAKHDKNKLENKCVKPQKTNFMVIEKEKSVDRIKTTSGALKLVRSLNTLEAKLV